MKKFIRVCCSFLLMFALLLPIFPTALATMEEETELELFASPGNITAQAAIVMDYETGEVLWSRDADTRRDPASMTKNMTAFLVYEEIAAGRLTFDSMIPISQNAENASRRWDWGGRYIRAGQSHSVETLLRLIMLPSHNGACVAVAEYISGSEAAFVNLMNQTAERLGVSAHFINAHGAAAGNRVSSRGMATLVREFIQTHPDILRITQMTSFTFMGGHTPNTNLLLPGNSFFTQGADGFKTGTTAAAGHCLSATAMRGGRRVVTVVMNAPHNNGRYGDTRNLFNFGFAELERRATFFDSLTVSVSANTQTVRRNANFTLTAQIGNVAAGGFYVSGASWSINGQTVQSMGSFSPQNNQTVTFTHAIAANSPLETLEATFSVRLPNGSERTASITLPVSSAEPALFRDINRHWAEADIERAVSLGLFSGVNSHSFAPNGSMTRAMFVTVLGRMADEMGIDISSSGTTPFHDVPMNEWFAPYIAWAWEQGIVQGMSSDRFAVNQVITRQEAATFFYRFMQHYDIILPGESTMHFPDMHLIDAWAYDAMTEAVRTGLLRGTDRGYLAPRAPALRAEAVVLFLRFIDAYHVDAPYDPAYDLEEEPPVEQAYLTEEEDNEIAEEIAAEEHE